MNFSDGNWIFSSSTFATVRILGLIVDTLVVLAYNRINSCDGNTTRSRAVISSTAEFDPAQTKQLSVELPTICSIAATTVLVFPVPKIIQTIYSNPGTFLRYEYII